MANISVIIPTYKRKTSLLRLLDSLGEQKDADFEIIVVEQGEDNGQALRKKALSNGLKMTYIHDTSVSTSKAKNIGAGKAKGEFLIFYDDDVTLMPHAIKNSLRNFRDPRVAGVAGRVITNGQPIEKDRNDTGRISIFGIFSDGFSSTVPQDVDTVLGCHAIWRKDVFVKAGGFDEQFTGNAMREESDLSLRIKQMGYKIIFDPMSVVTHHREPHGGARKADDRMNWYFHFFSNETYFFLRHRSLICFPLFLLLKAPFILRCMFGIGREVSRRSLTIPFLGIMNGVKKYDHRH